MGSVAEDVTHILTTLRALEDRMKTLRAMLNTAKRERKPNEWILFNKRIDALMKENNTSFTRIGDAKKFASSLKKQKAYATWTNEEIINERTDWLMNTLQACVVCEENPKDDINQHRDCIVAFATQDAPVKNPVGAWMRASSTPRTTTTKVKVVNEMESELSLPGSL